MAHLFLILTLITTLSVSLCADVLSTILETRKIRVCIWPEYYSISYVNPRTQELMGIDVDLAKEFAKELGVNLAFKESSFATLIQDITTQKCDMAMFAIGHTPERKERLYLTSPHLASDVYAVTSKSNKRIQTWDDIDQEGVVVAVAKGTYHVALMQKSLQKAQLRVVDSLHAREQEVEAGRADVFMTDYPFGIRMVEEREWAKLIAPTKPFNVVPYGWAMAQNEPAFQGKVEVFIVAIKHDGRLLEAAKRHHLEPIVFPK
ncbi:MULTISPECIES: ABC transporter substrate-binding protein [unclassified Sulfurospirillum]|uniref:substrate-binding periplasmic protein n=1 Tax=unclassified Sulfurospirillum TaxID=2618290 RepID=UPI000506CBF5|nr:MULTISPECIES: ABC transporter substrate-binding protein [unclassified Sulfurospirillum]KFL34643.1 amino acid ABC transporter substrate-binding protein [Sulfurospirillum sp. SCADC]